MGAVTESIDLRSLLELRTAVPADIDGDTLLLRCDLPGTMQLFRTGLRGGELEQLTSFPDPVEGHLVPGSGRIVLEHDDAGNELMQLSLLAPAPRASPEALVHDPRYAHRGVKLSADGALIAYSTNRDNGVDWAVIVRSLEDGEERCVIAPRGINDAAGFSPDGRFLVTSREGARSGDVDLFLVELATGDVLHVTPHEGIAFYGEPVWRPDGSFFFVAGDEGRDVAAISGYDLATRTWTLVVESEWELACRGDASGRWLLVAANEDGYSRFELYDAQTVKSVGEIELPGDGVAFADEVVFARDGSCFAFNFSSPVDPGDAWVYDCDTRGLHRATQLPRPIALDELREPVLHRFDSFDGEQVPVFLWTPDSGGPFPVVVMVHGGPESQFRPAFLPSFTPLTQHLVSRGYAVAAPNVRGSSGYGKRYVHLDDGRLRLDSVRDLATLHDWLGTQPELDASRVVLYGRSYGGYMTLAGLAFQPERWAAGIEMVGISNFVTFLENTAPWRRAAREREYGTLEHDREFLVDASPLTHVDRIRAPLFIQHGANDPRVPLGETQQIHRVLTAKGIRCELVVHSDEGHAIGKLENRVETFERAVSFLEEVIGR
jgi:dipeptidyl aminopeptidase/acylaminoacyl peptidase